eukprot:1355807-Amorphochlora_amoeboformis.AAC.2
MSLHFTQTLAITTPSGRIGLAEELFGLQMEHTIHKLADDYEVPVGIDVPYLSSETLEFPPK